MCWPCFCSWRLHVPRPVCQCIRSLRCDHSVALLWERAWLNGGASSNCNVDADIGRSLGPSTSCLCRVVVPLVFGSFGYVIEQQCSGYFRVPWKSCMVTGVPGDHDGDSSDALSAYSTWETMLGWRKNTSSLARWHAALLSIIYQNFRRDSLPFLMYSNGASGISVSKSISIPGAVVL